MCGKPVQIITYLPLANYLIDQEHDSVVIMGGQYNRASPSRLAHRTAKTASMPDTGCLPAAKG
jgi:DeoR/GlpR family transcriptional regulator of sugar metabolism